MPFDVFLIQRRATAGTPKKESFGNPPFRATLIATRTIACLGRLLIHARGTHSLSITLATVWGILNHNLPHILPNPVGRRPPTIPAAGYRASQELQTLIFSTGELTACRRTLSTLRSVKKQRITLRKGSGATMTIARNEFLRMIGPRTFSTRSKTCPISSPAGGHASQGVSFHLV